MRGAPHEIMSLYNLCTAFHKLPSEIEKEDPVTLEALMVINRAAQRKAKYEERRRRTGAESRKGR